MTTATGKEKTARWCTCRLLQVLDGTVQQLSHKTGKELSKTYDAGMAYVLWYANPEMSEAEELEEWFVLNLKKCYELGSIGGSAGTGTRVEVQYRQY